MKFLASMLVAALIAGLGFAGSAQAHSGHGEEGWRDGHRNSAFRAPGHRPAARGDAGFRRHVERRQSRQRHRIQEGRISGALTYRELAHLRSDQRRIGRLERRFGADSRFSHMERLVLQEALDEASDHIYRKKHNERYGEPHHRHYAQRH